MRNVRFRPVRAVGHVFPRIWFLLFLVYPLTAQAESGKSITLPKAVETALRDNPRLAGYPLEFQAAEGRALQASLRPNPELSVDVENAWWDYPGTSRAETTFGIS